MTKTFNKAAVFTDIHFGIRNNSRQHNDDCEDFIKWFIKTARENDCETCIFSGDWHHHRNSVNVSTLNYTVSNLKRLSDNFETVYMLTGNHDLFYREKREIHSFPFAALHENIKIFNSGPELVGETLFVPWLVEDEWRRIPKIKAKYVFGHFELPTFKMNAMVEMPDHGGLKAEDFTHPEYVFSGHFHKRQSKGRVHYLGSPFAQNYSDAWDSDRGMMILEWGGKPRYINWQDSPRYITINLSALLENPDQILNSKTYCKVYLDIPISYEEATFIKETFHETYSLREIHLLPQKKTDEGEEWKGSEDIEIENVDKVVITQLEQLDSEKLDKKKLIEIYNQL